MTSSKIFLLTIFIFYKLTSAQFNNIPSFNYGNLGLPTLPQFTPQFWNQIFSSFGGQSRSFGNNYNPFNGYESSGYQPTMNFQPFTQQLTNLQPYTYQSSSHLPQIYQSTGNQPNYLFFGQRNSGNQPFGYQPAYNQPSSYHSSNHQPKYQTFQQKSSNNQLNRPFYQPFSHQGSNNHQFGNQPSNSRSGFNDIAISQVGNTADEIYSLNGGKVDLNNVKIRNNQHNQNNGQGLRNVRINKSGNTADNIYALNGGKIKSNSVDLRSGNYDGVSISSVGNRASGLYALGGKITTNSVELGGGNDYRQSRGSPLTSWWSRG